MNVYSPANSDWLTSPVQVGVDRLHLPIFAQTIFLFFLVIGEV